MVNDTDKTGLEIRFEPHLHFGVAAGPDFAYSRSIPMTIKLSPYILMMMDRCVIFIPDKL